MEETQFEITTDFHNKLISEMLQEYQNKKLDGYIKNSVIKLVFQKEDEMNKRKRIETIQNDIQTLQQKMKKT
jgi:hypothetical protein